MTHGRKNDVPELSVDPRPSGNLVVRAFVESGMIKWDQIENNQFLEHFTKVCSVECVI